MEKLNSNNVSLAGEFAVISQLALRGYVAKGRPMPTHERLGTDNREDLKDQWKPAIQLDKEPAIGVCESDPARHLTPQNDQLMSERRVLGALRIS
jgi:hypothetical protein